MKIALVTMQLGSRYRHGTEHYVASLAAELRARGHFAWLLAGDPLGTAPRSPLGAPVDSDPNVEAYPTRGWMTVEGLSGTPVRRWLEEKRPDLVHLVNPAHVGVGMATACRTLGIPWVVTTMDFWWVCPRATLLRQGKEICAGSRPWRDCLQCISSDHPRAWLRLLGQLPTPVAPITIPFYAAKSLALGASPREALLWTRRQRVLIDTLDSAAQIIFPSPATRDAICPHLSHNRWQLIPYGLEPHWFEQPRAGFSSPKPRKELVIGYAGSLQPHKGAHLLLEAMTALGWFDTSVRIAGTQDDEAYAGRLARAARGLQVEFSVARTSAQMQAFLRSLDVLVVPSRWPENLPFVLLEAQAARVPVIASDVPGMTDRIPEKRLRFQPDSASDLARALADFAARPACEEPPSVPTLAEMAVATEAAYHRAVAHD